MILLKKIITCHVLTILLISSFSYTVKLHGCAEIEWWVSARQGRRDEMEDRHSVQKSGNLHFFAIFDGHAGVNAAEYAKEHLHENFFGAEGKTIGERLKNAVLTTDKNFLDDPKFKDDKSGTTAVIAVVDTDTNELVIANTGDSRAVVIRGSEVLLSTKDHKPEEESERKRIEKAGGFVSTPRNLYLDCHRVNGVLGVSRAIGDRHLKKSVISDPDIYEEFFEEDDVVVLACDGVLDVMTNKEVAELVHKKLSKPDWVIRLQAVSAKGTGNEIVEEGGNNKQAELAAGALGNEAYGRGSEDNISAFVVKLGSPSWSTRLFNLISANTNIILSLGGVVAMVFCLHKWGCFSSS